MAWHDVFDNDRGDCPDDIALKIVEDFHDNVHENYSSSWGKEPWTKYFFPADTSFSTMVEVKEAVEERLRGEATVTLDFEHGILMVK